MQHLSSQERMCLKHMVMATICHTGDSVHRQVFRIRFHFDEFHFNESIGYHSALEIGDGLIRGTGTRLAHFRGSEVPMDVTSVSNAAWMQVYDPYTIHLSNLAIVSFSKPVII